ncbi:MAG: hypothetical protein MRK00_15545 [Nitrosomonas sp.]|nr:hypothetical protein [Nitrosomonas sp.]
MKLNSKNFFQAILAAILFTQIQLTFADTADDTATVLNWAENKFPEVFPGHRATQNISPWLFRFYPETAVYVGVNTNDNNVYVLGGPWGDTPTRVDSLANLVNLVRKSGGGGISACNTENVPSGINYSQSGNVVTVTTNGQCVPAPNISDPTNSNLCVIPQQQNASGISVLSSNTVTASSLEGITITTPGLPNPFQAIVDANASVKHCTINAATGTADLIVNSDLCFDITETLSELLASFPLEGVQVTPPVTYASAGTYASQVVPDCFATDAATVTDAFTGEVWINQNGDFVKLGN